MSAFYRYPNIWIEAKSALSILKSIVRISKCYGIAESELYFISYDIFVLYSVSKRKSLLFE